MPIIHTALESHKTLKESEILITNNQTKPFLILTQTLLTLCGIFPMNHDNGNDLIATGISATNHEKVHPLTTRIECS